LKYIDNLERKLNIQEPKDPYLISNFLDKMKKSKALELSKSDRFKEKSIYEAKKRLEGGLEDKILSDKSRAKEFLINKRRLNKFKN
jgi:hypothetical protein